MREEGSMKLGELARQLGEREVEGDSGFELEGVATLADAGPSHLGFLRAAANASELGGSRVGALIAPPGVDVAGRPVIRSLQPNLDFARATSILLPSPRPAPGIHERAHVAATARVDPTAAIGALAHVGASCEVGAGSLVHAGALLLDDVHVGADCVIHAGAVVREGSRLGDRVILQPGAVIGGDGFGYEFNEKGELEKVPQVGRVVLEDDVEVGANTTIDRARLGETRIGRGTKIDNLVQVAHNVTIGAHSALVAQTGIAGSATLGERVFFMAQSGLAGHVEVGDGSFVGARGGVIGNTPAGSRVWGFPARAERVWHRSQALLVKLPELFRRVRRIERALEDEGDGE
jgi:UDP-3-O-[3-hydroxymyristoyl] glucosamine N-acyltransferase